MEKINGKCCVEGGLNGLLVDFFLQCSADKNLAATLQTKCHENGIESYHCHQEEKLVDLFKKLKQRRFVEEDNVDFLKRVTEADHREDLKKRIEQFEEGNRRLPDRYKTKSGGEKFRWPVTPDYGSNALLQVLLRFFQDEEHMNDHEKRAFYIYCDGIIEPSLDFSFYMKDPFPLIQKLVDREIIGPRNLDFLKRFFSLKTVRKPKEIAIIERFEAGAFIKQALAIYSGYSPNSTWEIDEPLMETAVLIKELTRKSFKGTKRLPFIKDLLQHVQRLESGEDRLHKLLNCLIKDAFVAKDDKQWQTILKLLVVAGELCCAADPPWIKIAEMSRFIGVCSPLDPKIILQTVSTNTIYLLRILIIIFAQNVTVNTHSGNSRFHFPLLTTAILSGRQLFVPDAYVPWVLGTNRVFVTPLTKPLGRQLR